MTVPYSLIPGPPPVKRPSPDIFAQMGEANIEAMLRDFYARLAASDIAHLFPSTPDGLDHAADKSAAFFIGLLGGPPRYHERFGSPMMRARHQPFAITDSARMVWLRCFAQTLEVAPKRFNFPEEHLADFKNWLSAFSAWMVNTPEDGERASD